MLLAPGDLPFRKYELPEPGRTVWVADDESELAHRLKSLGLKVRQRPNCPGEITHPWRPSPFVAAIARTMSPSKALDLGCGSGRDSVYLALRGWQVTAIDHLPECLERGMALARNLDVADRIDWHRKDLRSVSELPSADLTLMIRYFDSRITSICSGLIAIQTFSAAHRARTSHPSSPQLIANPQSFPGCWHRERGEFQFILVQSDK
jgi:SAM-dependent methyltransferase